MDNLYTIPQVAEKMGVSRQAVYLWIREGKLPTVKTLGGRYRIPKDKIEISIPEKGENYYPIYDISGHESDSLEPLGTKRKLWFKRTDKYWFWECDGGEFLFKIGREGTGENWAEKIACELCRSLKLPHAEYDFAEWKGIRGVITPNFVPHGYELELGNELLAASIWGYPKVGFRQNQPLRFVLAVIGSEDEDGKYLTQVPLNWQIVDGIESASDVFIGYLLLDALIANTDRHHENWGRLIDIEKRRLYLAPTFDHASSLGRN